MDKSTSLSPDEMFLLSLASARETQRSRRLEPVHLRTWRRLDNSQEILEPMWLARIGRLVDLNCSKETEVPRLSKPHGGHPWERVVRRRCRTLEITIEQLAQRMDETPSRLNLLFHFAPLWQTLEPRLSRALSTTSFALSASIERETILQAEDRERRKEEKETHQRLLRERRDRARRSRANQEGRS